jgi:NitT/TauT family transport system ATP-binding protein
MVRWGQVAHTDACLPKVEAAYRPDIYRDVLSASATGVPLIDGKIEGAGSGRTVIPTTGVDLVLDPQPFIDRRTFDASDIPGYVNGFAIRTR